jgi:uncharacterized protein (TIGR02453 family)
MNFERAFTFLKKLSRNNNREWFAKQKDTFIEIKDEFEDFACTIYNEIVAFDESLGAQDPKKCVFRIYRDVRFSKDKSPYKKFLSAGFSSAGKGTGKPGYYLQLEPNNKSFICVGLYSPSGDDLGKVRQEIDYNGDKLKEVMSNKKFKTLFPKFWEGDSLKTVPKGYAKDHPYVDLLKLKSYVIMHRFNDEDVYDKKFAKKLIDVIKVGKPLNDFLKAAIDE